MKTLFHPRPPKWPSYAAGLALLFLSACTEEIPAPTEPGNEVISQGTYENPFENLFLDLTNYYVDQPALTKSTTGQASVAGLLDAEKKQAVRIGDASISETPFLSNAEPSIFCISSARLEDNVEVDPDSLYVNKTFYIESNLSGTEDRYVVAMLAKYSFVKSFGEGFSYLNKAGYTGIIIFSDTDGTYSYMSTYIDGECARVQLVPRGCKDALETPMYIIPTKQIETKSTIDTSEKTGTIDPAYCVAELGDKRSTKEKEQDVVYVQPIYNHVEDNTPSSGGGGGGSSANKDSGGDSVGAATSKPDKKARENLDGIKIDVQEGLDESLEVKLNKKFDEICSIGNEALNNILAGIDTSSVTIKGEACKRAAFYITNQVLEPKVNTTYVNGIAKKQVVYFPEYLLDSDYDSPIYILEELLHVYQRQDSVKDEWGTGDYEFEAKCYWSYLVDTYHLKLTERFNPEQVILMSNFFKNRTQDAYEKAMEQYRAIFPEYNNSSYPITVNYNDVFKHFRFR